MVNSTNPHAWRRLVVLGTGGTIAGRAANRADNIGYTAAEVGVGELLGDVDAPDGMSLVAEQVAQIDSKDMDFTIWQTLAARCAHWLAFDDVAGVVVTHGTDTLEETAFFLQSVLSPAKPVVLTCAMRPSTALAPDGPQNLRDALTVAAYAGARGVTVVCAGTVHSAFDVQKVHTYRLDAFGSGDSGPVAYVEEGGLRRLRDWPADSTAAAATLPGRVAKVSPAAWPRVDIVMSHAGVQGGIVDALRRAPELPPLEGLVIAATGNGSIHHSLASAASQAQAEGVAVVRATRCVEGRILPRPDDVWRDAGALTPAKARIALMLELLMKRILSD